MTEKLEEEGRQAKRRRGEQTNGEAVWQSNRSGKDVGTTKREATRLGSVARRLDREHASAQTHTHTQTHTTMSETKREEDKAQHRETRDCNSSSRHPTASPPSSPQHHGTRAHDPPKKDEKREHPCTSCKVTCEVKGTPRLHAATSRWQRGPRKLEWRAAVRPWEERGKKHTREAAYFCISTRTRRASQFPVFPLS